MMTHDIAGLALPEKYLSQVLVILRTHLPHAEIWAYGSRVNGDYYDASDLDLVVRRPDDLSRRQEKLWEVIDVFVESNLPIIVQLVDWAGIPDTFRNEITARYVVLQTPSVAVNVGDRDI